MKTILLLLSLACSALGQGLYFGSSVPAITNVTAGLTNWWRFNENTSTTANDSADSATATFNNGNTTWVASGKIGSAITNGVSGSGHLDLSTNDGFALTGGSMSSSFWVYPNAVMGSSGAGTVIYDSDGSTSGGWWWQVNTNSIEIHFYTSGISTRRIAAVSLPVNGWTHVVGTWDGTVTDATRIHIYTNSVEVGSYSSTQNGTGTFGTYNGTARYLGFTFGGTSVFYGMLDDVRVYTRVLNATEIALLYQWNGQP